MSAPDPSAQKVPGIVNMDEYKKAHAGAVAQSLADATDTPTASGSVQSPNHALNDHMHGSEFEVIAPDKVEEAELKIPDQYKTEQIRVPGAETFNRDYITKVGFSPSKMFLEKKKQSAQAQAEAKYGKGAKIREKAA